MRFTWASSIINWQSGLILLDLIVIYWPPLILLYRLLILSTCLTHFSPVSRFYTPWKRQKTFGFSIIISFHVCFLYFSFFSKFLSFCPAEKFPSSCFSLNYFDLMICNIALNFFQNNGNFIVLGEELVDLTFHNYYFSIFRKHSVCRLGSRS